jgi:hypothetical protein
MSTNFSRTTPISNNGSQTVACIETDITKVIGIFLVTSLANVRKMENYLYFLINQTKYSLQT